MSAKTGIEWADSTWSPWRGCTEVSEGCAHCYARDMAKRNPAVLGEWGKGAPRVKNKDWRAPLGWNAGRRVCPECGTYAHAETCMVCRDQTPTRRLRIFPSLCDWLDDEIPIEWLAEFLALIHATPNLDWLLLTKRPENWKQRIAEVLAYHHLRYRDDRTPWPAWNFVDGWIDGIPPSNVWFGVSVENQKRAAERVPILLKIPAALRWLSLEPLIGPVDLTNGKSNRWSVPTSKDEHGNGIEWTDPGESFIPVDWLVIGGESGTGARPCHVEWIRSLLKQGTAAGVPVFVKQLGANPWGTWLPYAPDLRPLDRIGWGNRVCEKKGGDPNEWPVDLRVRAFPNSMGVVNS